MPRLSVSKAEFCTLFAFEDRPECREVLFIIDDWWEAPLTFYGKHGEDMLRAEVVTQYDKDLTSKVATECSSLIRMPALAHRWGDVGAVVFSQFPTHHPEAARGLLDLATRVRADVYGSALVDQYEVVGDQEVYRCRETLDFVAEHLRIPRTRCAVHSRAANRGGGEAVPGSVYEYETVHKIANSAEGDVGLTEWWRRVQGAISYSEFESVTTANGIHALHDMYLGKRMWGGWPWEPRSVMFRQCMGLVNALAKRDKYGVWRRLASVLTSEVSEEAKAFEWACGKAFLRTDGDTSGLAPGIALRAIVFGLGYEHGWYVQERGWGGGVAPEGFGFGTPAMNSAKLTLGEVRIRTGCSFSLFCGAFERWLRAVDCEEPGEGRRARIARLALDWLDDTAVVTVRFTEPLNELAFSENGNGRVRRAWREVLNAWCGAPPARGDDGRSVSMAFGRVS